MNLHEFGRSINKMYMEEENDNSLSSIFTEELENIIYQQTPEQKTELHNLNCSGTYIEGFLIKNDTIRLTYVDYDELDEGSELKIEGFSYAIENITKIRDEFKSMEELDNIIDIEDPTYEVYYNLIENPSLKIEVQLITNKVVPKMVEMLAKGISIDRGIEVIFFDFHKINNFLENYSSNEQRVIEFNDTDVEYVKNSYSDLDIYFFILPATILAKLYDRYGTTLLQDNVRLFLKSSGVNKAINKTLEIEPEYFLSYNNGLSAVCKDVKFKKDKKIKSLSELQIVNGGQTTASLHNAFKNKVDLSKAFVQVKLTHIKNQDNYKDMVIDIAKYANSQNKINNSDFASSDKFFVQLEKYSKTEGVIVNKKEDLMQYVFFERMRGQKKIEEGNLGKKNFREMYFLSIDIKSIAQVENIWNDNPSKASQGGEKSLSFFIDNIRGILSVQEYGKIIGRILLVKKVEELMELSTAPGTRYKKSSRAKNFGPIASTIKYYTMYTLFQKLKKDDEVFSEIFYSKSADGLVDEAHVLKIINATFEFFAEKQTEINMTARDIETEREYKEFSRELI